MSRSKQLSNLAASAACLGLLVWGCQEEPTSSGTGAGSCILTSFNPYNCFIEDSVPFFTVEVGDTLSVNFCIEHNWTPYDPYDSNPEPPPPIRVSIGQSTCANFTWTTGEWTLVANAGKEHLQARFHPVSASTFSCKLPVNGCSDLRLVGVGVDESGTLPPHRGRFGVTNNGAYQARVSVAYDYRSGIIVPWERDTVQVLIPTSEYNEIHLPRNFQVNNENLVRDVEIRAEGESAPGVWETIFLFTFPAPVMKCYRLEGTTNAPAWSEAAGCNFIVNCSCF